MIHSLGIILLLISSATLLLVFYQDMRFRAVSWIIFPALAVIFIIAGTIDKGLYKYLEGTAIALLLIMIQMLLIQLVFRLRYNKEKIGFINHVFGLGDLLLFFVLCFAFSPLNLVLFLTLSSIITLGIYLPQTIIKKDPALKIPLAGMISLAYVIVIIPLRLVLEFDPLSDSWVLNLTNKLLMNGQYGLY